MLQYIHSSVHRDFRTNITYNFSTLYPSPFISALSMHYIYQWCIYTRWGVTTPLSPLPWPYLLWAPRALHYVLWFGVWWYSGGDWRVHCSCGGPGVESISCLEDWVSGVSGVMYLECMVLFHIFNSVQVVKSDPGVYNLFQSAWFWNIYIHASIRSLCLLTHLEDQCSRRMLWLIFSVNIVLWQVGINIAAAERKGTSFQYTACHFSKVF